MERLTSVGGSRRGWIGHLVLLALLLTGPEVVARVISLVTSAVTFPLTGQLRFADNRYEVFNVELLLIYLVAVLGLNLLLQSGLVSIGHSAFFGLGAYVVAIATVDGGWSFYLALPVAGVVAGLLGVLLGLPALRLGLFALVMVTIGYAFVANDLSLEWRGLTGGGDGLRGVHFPAPFDDLASYYWLLVIVVVLVYTLHLTLLRSPFGRASKAIEESEVAARSLGISPYVAKLRAFSVSAALAGIAGGLYVPVIGFIAPDSFTVDLAILLLLMVLLGGAGTVVGPVVGAVLLFRLPIEVDRLTGQAGELPLLVYGVLLLLSVFLFPRGLMSAWWRLRARFRRRPGPQATERARAEIAGAITPVPDGGAVLRLTGVRKAFSGVRALDGVDLTVEAGTVHALIGPNGSGKTTLLNTCSGFLAPDDGSVAFRGEPAAGGVPARARDGLGRTFQTPFVFAEMSLLENVLAALDAHRRHGMVAHALRLPGARREERANVDRATAILTAVGLAGRIGAPAGALPPGERRLLEIARVVALDPVLVLMDEPAAGLSGPEIEELEDVVRALRAAGVAVLLVEHHVDLVMRLADTVTVVDFGRVIAHGEPAEVARDPRVVAAYLGGSAEPTPVSAVEEVVP